MRLHPTRRAAGATTRRALACAVLVLTSGQLATAHAAPAAAPIDVDAAGACQAIDAGGQLLAPDSPRVRTRPDRTDLEDQPPGVLVSPVAFDVTRELRPGDSFTCTVTVRNRRPTSTTYELEPVGQRGRRGGGTEFVRAEQDEAGVTAATWMDPVTSSITLAPNQIGELPVVVTVPSDPPRGSAYGSIVVLRRTDAAATGGDASVGIRSGAAVALLLRIGGDGTPKLTFTDTRAPLLRTDRAAWTWRARLRDEGTLHAVPRGRLRVRSMFGRTVARFPIETRVLLPGGDEPVAVTWKDTPWFGLYRYDVRVDARGATGASGARAEGWIIALPPWWIIALVVLAASGAAAWPLVQRRREWRRYLDEDEEADDTGAPG